MTHVFVELTTNCNVTIDPTNNACAIAWDNGLGIKSVTGATTDYIPRERFIHVDQAQQRYSFGDDYLELVKNSINPKLAFIMCWMRQIVLSIHGIKVNAAEMISVAQVNQKFIVHKDVTDMLATNHAQILNILQQSVTILAINGISLVTKGHHFDLNDPTWTKFDQATLFNLAMSVLNVPNWEGVIFHDTFHPVDYNWLAKQVCDKESAIIPHLNGIASRRIPAQPAGTIIVPVLIALIEELNGLHPQAYESVKDALDPLRKLQIEIHSNPLDWCILFAKPKTIQNLSRIYAFHELAAYTYGMNQGIVAKPTQAMRSKAMITISKQRTGQVSIGKLYVEQTVATQFDTNAARDSIIASAKTAISENDRLINEAAVVPIVDIPK